MCSQPLLNLSIIGKAIYLTHPRNKNYQRRSYLVYNFAVTSIQYCFKWDDRSTNIPVGVSATEKASISVTLPTKTYTIPFSHYIPKDRQIPNYREIQVSISDYTKNTPITISDSEPFFKNTRVTIPDTLPHKRFTC